MKLDPTVLAAVLLVTTGLVHAQPAQPPGPLPTPPGATGPAAPQAAIESARRAAAEARRPAAAVPAGPAPEPNTNLEEFVRTIAGNANVEVLIDARVPAEIYVGGTPLRRPGYADLFSVLKLNGLAAAEVDGRLQIVPQNEARTLPTPIVQDDDADIPGDAWVTRVITVRNYPAASLVPILRPMLPQFAQFAARFDANNPDGGSLVIVDRYSNVRRISAIIEQLTQ